MFILEDMNDSRVEFGILRDLQEYVEERHAEEGGFEWLSEIRDDKGNHYGCTWKLEIEEK